jgi:hypothetical protein
MEGKFCTHVQSTAPGFGDKDGSFVAAFDVWVECLSFENKPVSSGLVFVDITMAYSWIVVFTTHSLNGTTRKESPCNLTSSVAPINVGPNWQATNLLLQTL